MTYDRLITIGSDMIGSSDINAVQGFSGDSFDLKPQYMARAIQLARRGWCSVTPNPRVGCVVVRDGSVIAEGWHEKAGEAHAEAMALKNAISDVRGATAYVTLEPCSFHGRTPACSNALIQAGIKQVVIASLDPHPKVSGSGLAALHDAGIATYTGLLADEALALNKGHVKRQKLGLPWVSCKMAASLDGRTAMASGESQWITGADARRDVQRLRAQSCAILTGANTVIDDNPAMSVRSCGLPDDESAQIKQRQPIRVVLDNDGRCPPEAKIFRQAGRTLVFSNANAVIDKSAFAELDVELIALPGEQIDLTAVLQELALREINHVMLESGPTLAGAMLQQGLVDELYLYFAGKLLGSDGRPMFRMPIENMADSIELNIQDIRAIGKDWRLHAYLSNGS